MSTRIGSPIWLLIVGVSLAFVSGPSVAQEVARPNVLFIAVDDLRPELNCYGRTHIHSPNIDRLAASGTLFERAYCMVPTCGASRAALMTGLRPAPHRFVNYLTWAERDAEGIKTLNTHFKEHGYATASLGKIFHHLQDNADGWTQPPWRPARGLANRYNVVENQRIHSENSKRRTKPNRGPAYEAGDVDDDAYPDGQVALEGVRRIERLSTQEKPFFLAVGFYKPHLPFNCPKKYWDLYDFDSIDVPENYYPPEGAPPGAVHSFGELRSYHGIPNEGILDRDTARRLIHGYYACVSYTDALVGQLLDALEAAGVADNTVVILWGDHGWNLGEHTMWCKHSCFETSLHAPIVVHAPGFPTGNRTRALTEFIDIYPSLCDLAGLPRPAHLQGRSFVPLMRDPEAPWKSAAISRYRSGDSIRTDQHRFTQYWNRDGEPVGRMLYHHSSDPGENWNLAGEPEQGELVEGLFQQLSDGMGR